MKNKSLLLTFFFICVLIGGVYATLRPCQRLYCISIKDGDQYQLKDLYEESAYAMRALYEKGDLLLRMDVRLEYSKEDAESAIQARLVMTKGLFEDAAAPYPDQLSDILSCGEQFKPVYSTRDQNGMQISYFDGFVNDRLVLGSCASDTAAYHDTFTMFYCEKQRKFYQLEIIIPTKGYSADPTESDEILHSIRCN